jgi:hypothetical protein
MKLLRVCSAFLVGFTVCQAVPASAQATRTWVSGVGDDANPCSRTAPCKTFAGAILKTAAGGAINCLDPGGFGAVVINKSITISCLYTEGGVLAGGNGITINAGPADVVYLKGLDIFGVSPPQNGVRFIAGGALHIEQSVIRRFNGSNSYGLSVATSRDSKVYIKDSTIADNGNGSTGGGIAVQPTGTGGANVFIIDSMVSNNAGHAIFATGSGAAVHVTGSHLLGNAVGILAEKGARVTSYSDNMVAGNTTDGEFSGSTSKD